MRIDRVRVDVISLDRTNAIFVRVDTDAGLTGVGETVLKRRDRTVEANVREIGEALIGKDPLTIEDHFEKLYRDSFWVGGPLHAAGRSAVDIALWDIKGQHHGAAIHALLGGPTRTSIPMYAHVACGATPEEFVANLRPVIDRGFGAAKTGLPLFYGRRATERIDRTS